MRFLVLGAGALGGYFGAKLIRGGADVTFLVRPARAAQLQRDGLVVKAQDGELRTRAKTVQQGQVNGSYDVILLCCKAYDLKEAISAITPAMGDQSVILPLLNGVRHIDVLTQTFGPKRVLGGLTLINAVLMADGTIQQVSCGSTQPRLENSTDASAPAAQHSKQRLKRVAFQSKSVTTSLPGYG